MLSADGRQILHGFLHLILTLNIYIYLQEWMRALASTHSVLYAIYYWIALEYLQLAVLCFVQCSSLSCFLSKNCGLVQNEAELHWSYNVVQVTRLHFDDLVLKFSTHTQKNQHLRNASEKSSKERLNKLHHYGDFALLSILKQVALNKYKQISLLFSFWGKSYTKLLLAESQGCEDMGFATSTAVLAKGPNIDVVLPAKLNFCQHS